MNIKVNKGTFLFVLIGIIACQNQETKSHSKQDIIPKDSIQKTINTTSSLVSTHDSISKEGNKDSLRFFYVDDYNIDDNWLLYDTIVNKSGDVYSQFINWFSNDTLKQTMVFEHVSGTRVFISCFLNDEIPNEIIERMSLSCKMEYGGFSCASFEQKKLSMKGFIGSAKRISQILFITKKGISLGQEKSKAIQVYGKPDKIQSIGTFEKYQWSFIGDWILKIYPDSIPQSYEKPFALNSWGHEVVMYFKDEKLKALILKNQIP